MHVNVLTNNNYYKTDYKTQLLLLWNGYIYPKKPFKYALKKC